MRSFRRRRRNPLSGHLRCPSGRCGGRFAHPIGNRCDAFKQVLSWGASAEGEKTPKVRCGTSPLTGRFLLEVSAISFRICFQGSFRIGQVCTERATTESCPLSLHASGHCLSLRSDFLGNEWDAFKQMLSWGGSAEGEETPKVRRFLAPDGAVSIGSTCHIFSHLLPKEAPALGRIAQYEETR